MRCNATPSSLINTQSNINILKKLEKHWSVPASAKQALGERESERVRERRDLSRLPLMVVVQLKNN